MAKYHPVFIFFRLIVSTACILHRVTSTNTTRCPSYWSSRCLPVLHASHHVITVFVTQCVRSPSTITSIYYPQAHFVNCLYLTQGYTKTTKTTTTNILIISVSVCTTYITSSLCVSGLHHQASSPSIYYPKAYCAHCLYPTQGYINKYNPMSIILIISVSSILKIFVPSPCIISRVTSRNTTRCLLYWSFPCLPVPHTPLLSVSYKGLHRKIPPGMGAWVACWWSAGLVIERLRVRIPAGAAGEFSSPELTLCADSYSMSIPPQCYRSGTWKITVIMPKYRWQVTPKHVYTLDPTKSEWADYAVQAQYGNMCVCT